MVERAIHVRRFTRKEYERMAAQGIFAPDERAAPTARIKARSLLR